MRINNLLHLFNKIVIICKDSKVPINDKWLTERFKPYTTKYKDNRVYLKKPFEENIEKLRGYYNFAGIPNLDLLVLDVDVKEEKEGLETLNKLEENTKKKYIKNVKTPSGGYHIYFVGKVNLEKLCTFKLKHIDLLYSNSADSGHMVMIPPSIIGNEKYTTLSKCYNVLSDKVTNYLAPKNISHSTESYELSDLSEDKIISYLRRMPSDDHQLWIKIGMIIKTWDSGEKGYNLFDKWSQSSDKYDEKVVFKKWEIFKSESSDKKLITYRSLYTLYKQVTDVYSNFINDKLCTTFPVSDNDLNSYLDDKTNKYKDFSKIRFDNREYEDRFYELRDTPWYKYIVFIHTYNKYYNLVTGELYSSEGLDIEFSDRVPEPDKGSKPYASVFVKKNCKISSANRCEYLPTFADAVVKSPVDGVNVVNLFSHKTVPKPSNEISKEGSLYIEKLVKHIYMLCNNDSYISELFLSWIAYNVQYMGNKIIWSPIVQSIEGLGKSFLHKLLSVVMGETNVRVIDNSDISERFTPWCRGHSVVCIEELKLPGHNRYTIVNKLKPYISNSIVTYNDKNIRSHQVCNVTNYICFTNFEDAIPIDDHDRRWFVIFTEIYNKQKIASMFGYEDVGDYFQDLYEGLSKYKSDIRKFLLEYKLHKDFNPVGDAPRTKFRGYIIDDQKDLVDGRDEVIELLEQGGVGYNKNIIVSSYLYDVLLSKLSNSHLNYLKRDRRAKNKILTSLGYKRVPERVRVSKLKKLVQVWFKGEEKPTIKDINALFEEKVNNNVIKIIKNKG